MRFMRSVAIVCALFVGFQVAEAERAVSCAYPNVLPHFSKLIVPSLPALQLQQWNVTPKGVTLGRGLLVRGCEKYQGGISGLANDLQESLSQGLQCLQKLKVPAREQDALQLFALFYDPPSPIEIDCVESSLDPLSNTSVPDAIAKATWQCDEKYSFSIQVDLSVLPQVKARKEIWLHEILHLLRYPHNKGMDVVFLTQWCCSSEDPEQQSKACHMLTQGPKLSQAEYLSSFASLLQKAKYNDLALWTPWLDVIHYQRTQRVWYTEELLKALTAMTALDAPIVNYHKQLYQKDHPNLFQADKVDQRLPKIEGQDLTEDFVRKRFTWPFFALTLGHAALYANPATSDHPEWEQLLADSIADVFFPRTSPLSRQKRILARIIGRLVGAISIQDGVAYARIAKRARLLAGTTCYALDAREKKQLYSMFQKVSGSFGLFEQWQKDRIAELENGQSGDEEVLPPNEVDAKTFTSLWNDVVRACQASVPAKHEKSSTRRLTEVLLPPDKKAASS